MSDKKTNESCQTRRMYGHDYAIPGTYEVTIVVADRRPVFGKIVGTKDLPTFTSDYERFHYLNRLAEMVCEIGHTTDVVVQGLCLAHGG